MSKRNVFLCIRSLNFFSDTMATPLFCTKTAEFIQNNILPVGTNIPAQARVIINNILKIFTEIKIDPEKLQSVNFCRSHELAAAICGVSVRTVDKIKKECIKGEVSSPRESVYRPCTVTALDDFDKSVIKQIVSSFQSHLAEEFVIHVDDDDSDDSDEEF